MGAEVGVRVGRGSGDPGHGEDAPPAGGARDGRGDPSSARQSEPDRAAEPSPTHPYAALRRGSQGRQRKYASLLALGSVFEPEGRGFESLPACHFSSKYRGLVDGLEIPSKHCL